MTKIGKKLLCSLVKTELASEKKRMFARLPNLQNVSLKISKKKKLKVKDDILAIIKTYKNQKRKPLLFFIFEELIPELISILYNSTINYIIIFFYYK